MSTEAGKLDASSYAWNVMRSSLGLYFLASAFAVEGSSDQYETLSLGNRGRTCYPRPPEVSGMELTDGPPVELRVEGEAPEEIELPCDLDHGEVAEEVHRAWGNVSSSGFMRTPGLGRVYRRRLPRNLGSHRVTSSALRPIQSLWEDFIRARNCRLESVRSTRLTTPSMLSSHMSWSSTMVSSM